MHPEGRFAASLPRRLVALLCLAGLLAALAAAPVLGQGEGDGAPAFVAETRYVVPAPTLDTATAFVMYVQDDDAAGPLAARTLGLRAPAGPGELLVTNDTGATLHWVPRAHGGVDVGIPAGTREVHMVRQGIVLDDMPPRVTFAGPLSTLRVNLVVALTDDVRTDAASLPAGPATLASLPDGWPQPEGRRYLAASWAAADAPDRVSFDGPAVAETTPLPLPLAIALAVFLVAATLWSLQRVHRGVTAPTARRTMPILEHLNELRNRMLWVLGTLVVAAAFFFTFGFRMVTILGRLVPVPVPTIYDNAAAQTFSWLAGQVVAPGIEVIVTNPFDAVLTQIGLAIGLAVLVTFPVLFYHIYAFLAPGLRPAERRAVLLSVPFVVVLFLGGAAFGLLFMMPFTVRVLYSFAGTLSATAFLNVHDLVALAAALAVVFGLAFQLPLVMALTARIGLVRAATYRAKWRHAVIGIVIVAALVTDPTVITQLIVATVLSALYVVGLGLAYVMERRHHEPDAVAAADRE